MHSPLVLGLGPLSQACGLTAWFLCCSAMICRGTTWSSLYCAGTAGLNVPMFIALRRFTLVCTILLERLLLGKQHEKATLGAVTVMVGGGP